ncbi:MAG: DNA polymerase III subunit alpha [Anaerolineae bacterium]|jgi:error-prone DNA polymerase
MTSTVEYVELHCHSYFSLLDGASSPEALVDRAAALGYPALALTDHDGLYGAVRFWQAARHRSLKAIVGAEVTLDGTRPSHLTLLAGTGCGYANLCRILSTGQLAGQKGQPRLTLEALAEHAGGLICLSGCRQGAIPTALMAKDGKEAREVAAPLRDIFGPDRFWIEAQFQSLPADVELVPALASLARELDTGLVATNNVHYAERSGQRLHDLLTSIRHRATLPEALGAGLLHPNSEQYIKSAAQMSVLFEDWPEALRNTLRIAEQCDVCLDFSAQRLPAFPVPGGHTAESYLHHLCREGLARRFNPGTHQARTQLDHELGVIERLGLAGYFLVVWDIIRFAREQGIRCQGRGSAANSLAAYLLGITQVDPLRHNLLFERFLSEGGRAAGTMPDIDVDFAADRREEVIQYVYDRYGEEHVGMVCNVVTYRARSALRDAAKALVFPPDVIDRAAKALDTRSTVEAAESLLAASSAAPEEADLLPSHLASRSVSLRGPSLGPKQSPFATSEVVASATCPRNDILATAAPEETPDLGSQGEELVPLPWQVLSDLLGQMDGVPRHLSIHVGGMIITAAPLVEVVPLERATMPGRVVVQWDKDSVEDAGLIKIDLLSLRTLGVVEEAVSHIREQRGIEFEPADLPLDDPDVYDLLQRADTVGCFQVESRAQAQMLPKLQPERFEDIVVGVALIRPGPIQGGMVHPYLRRRQGLEPVSYAHPSLAEALDETLGVIVFQEQVLRVAMSVAGFTPAEADRLRRAMSRSRSQQSMVALRERFLRGARANGLEDAVSREIWQQLAGFAGFGFCKSHAAAFALLAYQTLYLKVHYPAEYYCALLNHQPMGFYPPEVIAGDARRHGVPVLRPNVNLSQPDCTLEQSTDLPPGAGLRLGLRYIHGLGEVWQERIVERRAGRLYRDLADFCRRARLPRSLVEHLIRSGAMDGLGKARRGLLWALGGLAYQEEGLEIEVPVVPASLPALGQAERMAWEYELLGLAPGDQVMSLYREALRAQRVLSSGELPSRRDGERVRVAGWAVVRQRPPTAKGHLFITLEDEEGLINLIVRPDVYERYRAPLRNSPLLWIEGRLQREGHALSVLVYRAAALGNSGS